MKGRAIHYSAEELAWIEGHKTLPRLEAHARFIDRFGRQRLKVARATRLGICLDHAGICAILDLVSLANDQLLAADRNRTQAMKMLQSARRRLTTAMLVLAFDLSLFVATIALILLKVLP